MQALPTAMRAAFENASIARGSNLKLAKRTVRKLTSTAGVRVRGSMWSVDRAKRAR